MRPSGWPTLTEVIRDSVDIAPHGAQRRLYRYAQIVVEAQTWPSIRPLDDKLKTTPTTALFKSSHLEVSRTVLRAGKDVPPHDVVGEMTVQCLEGQVELAAAGTTQLMRAGDLICLAGGETHSLKAIHDSSVLITMLLHGA